MKKLFYFFLLLPFSMLMSCSDDNKEFSPTDMTLTVSGVTEYNGGFYTVEGENVTLEKLTLKAIDGKDTEVANVTYYIDGLPLLSTPGNPFLGTFSTEGFAAGTYSLSLTGNLLQVDSPIKIFTANYPITIVETQEDLPAGAPELGTYSLTLRIDK